MLPADIFSFPLPDLGIRPVHMVPQHKGATWLTTQMHATEDTGRDYAAFRRAFLRNSFGFLAGAGAAAAVRPESANAIGDLFEFNNQARFAQHVTLRVTDMAAALKFYVQGIGMKILRTRAGPQFNTTVVGFGPEALRVPPDFVFGVSSMGSYGGHFTLELNSQKERDGEEDVDVYFDPGNGVQYLQIAVDNYRISNVIKAGGVVESGYGYLQLVAPGGLRLKLLSGERRDPPMFVAIKVKDLKRSITWYTDIAGMTQSPYPLARAPGSPFEPEQPKNSVFMAYEGDAFGVLLLPAGRGETLNPGSAFSLSVLADDFEKIAGDLGGTADLKSVGGRARSISLSDPDGYPFQFVDYSGWQKALQP